jgi:hypothetical protein
MSRVCSFSHALLHQERLFSFGFAIFMENSDLKERKL